MTIPVIETERLRLREWRETDFPAFAEFWADADTTRYLGGVCHREEAWRRMAAFAGHWILRGFGRWAVEEKASARFVGYCGPWYPEGFPEPEISWSLLKAFQGRGYATEAARRARAFAYRELGWRTAVSLIAAENAPSRRVAERLGARVDGSAEVMGHPVGVYRHPALDASSN